MNHNMFYEIIMYSTTFYLEFQTQMVTIIIINVALNNSRKLFSGSEINFILQLMAVGNP